MARGNRFRGESTENRFQSHAAVQCEHAETGVQVRDAGGRVFEEPAWLICSGVAHSLEPSPKLTVILIEPQSRLAMGLLRQIDAPPIAALPAAIGVLVDPSQPLAHCRKLIAWSSPRWTTSMPSRHATSRRPT